MHINRSSQTRGWRAGFIFSLGLDQVREGTQIYILSLWSLRLHETGTCVLQVRLWHSSALLFNELVSVAVYVVVFCSLLENRKYMTMVDGIY